MWGHMWNWGGMIMMVLIALLLLAILIGLIVLVAALVRRTQPPVDVTAEAGLRPGSALDILKERYARGEISREEYHEMRRELEA